MLSTLLQIAGLAAITVGAGFIFIPAGLVVGGICLVALGMSLERE
jgi:ammonia channel protein AmtB